MHLLPLSILVIEVIDLKILCLSKWQSPGECWRDWSGVMCTFPWKWQICWTEWWSCNWHTCLHWEGFWIQQLGHHDAAVLIVGRTTLRMYCSFGHPATWNISLNWKGRRNNSPGCYLDLNYGERMDRPRLFSLNCRRLKVTLLKYSKSWRAWIKWTPSLFPPG